jgi:hypothetical protein
MPDKGNLGAGVAPGIRADRLKIIRAVQCAARIPIYGPIDHGF